MLLSMIETLSSSLAVIRLSGTELGAKTFSLLEPICTRLRDTGFRAVLVDLTSLSRCTYSGVAGLVELSSVLGGRIRFGYCGLDARGLEILERSGLTYALPLFGDVATALNSPQFRSHRLTGLRAVVLAAGSGSRMAPLTQNVSKPMLDILGRPVLAHLASHCAAQGLMDLIINPGHLGEQIPAYFHENPPSCQSIFFVNEGHRRNETWHAEARGSASTLARLNCDHAAFRGDTFVMCGDALIDLDLAEMLAEHRASGAGVTIAAQQVNPEDVQKYGIIAANETGRITGFQEKPKPQEALSHLASTGIYIFSQDVLQSLRGEQWERDGLDIATDFLPKLINTGIRLQVFRKPFRWADLGNPNSYFSAVSAALCGTGPAVVPAGVQHRPGLWVARGAQVSGRARIDGPCYLGPNCIVEAGAKIEGPCAIGAGSRIERNSLVRNSIVWPNTHVQSGAIVNHMIVAGDWAVDHRFAKGGPVCSEPLDSVSWLVRTTAANVEWGALNRAGGL